MRRDKQLTVTAGFLDKRSYIAPDGRVILYGEDWANRKLGLLARSGGRCEMHSTPWHRCAEEAADPDHIIPRSKGRDDRLRNLQALCRYHHDLKDSRKIRSDRLENRRKNGA